MAATSYTESDGYEWLNDEDVADFPSDFAASSQLPAPVASNSIDRWGKLTDGREAKMAEMVYAKCIDAIEDVGHEAAFEQVMSQFPEYERLVAPRGPSLTPTGAVLPSGNAKQKSTLFKQHTGTPPPPMTVSSPLPLEQIGYIDTAQLEKRKINLWAGLHCWHDFNDCRCWWCRQIHRHNS